MLINQNHLILSANSDHNLMIVKDDFPNSSIVMGNNLISKGFLFLIWKDDGIVLSVLHLCIDQLNFVTVLILKMVVVTYNFLKSFPKIDFTIGLAHGHDFT